MVSWELGVWSLDFSIVGSVLTEGAATHAYGLIGLAWWQWVPPAADSLATTVAFRRGTRILAAVGWWLAATVGLPPVGTDGSPADLVAFDHAA